MTNMTDPAREIAELCTTIAYKSGEPGYAILSKAFGVESWSSEFYQIVFTVQNRIDELVGIIQTIEMDPDYRTEAVANIELVRRAFSIEGTGNQWLHSVQNYISPTQIGTLKMLSPMVRAKYSYPRLSEDERAELIEEVDQLLGWLNEHQLVEHDFIRAALIEGISQFRFRLSRLQWFGWGYSVASLREVVGAYMALEVGTPDLVANPVTGALLAKVSAFATSVYVKAGVVKSVVELSNFGLKAYGAIALFNPQTTNVAGLIGSIAG